MAQRHPSIRLPRAPYSHCAGTTLCATRPLGPRPRATLAPLRPWQLSIHPPGAKGHEPPVLLAPSRHRLHFLRAAPRKPNSRIPNPTTPTHRTPKHPRLLTTSRRSSLQNSGGLHHPKLGRSPSSNPIQNSRGHPFLHRPTRERSPLAPAPPTRSAPPRQPSRSHPPLAHQTTTPTRLQQVTAYPPSNRPPLPRPWQERLPPPSHRVSQHPSTSMSTAIPRTRATAPLTPTTKTLKRSPASGIRSQACAFPLNPSTRTSKTPICFTITNTYIQKTVITESRKNRNLFFRITAPKVFVLQNPSMTPCATRLRNNFAQAPKSRRDLTTWWGMV